MTREVRMGMLMDGQLCEHVGLADSQKMLARKPKWVAGNISPFDQPLLIGLTKVLQPKKVVEIGVASGWSGCLFIDALSQCRPDAQYLGIDCSKTYYLDASRNTGAAIGELFPVLPIDSQLLLGNMAVDCLEQVGAGVDLAFIDGDHLHPWALLDLLSLMPVLAPSAHVLMHDLSLSTFERHRHTNRGPKYLYECWPLAKIHSSQDPPMIGAIQMPEKIDDALLRLLLDTLYAPWETVIDERVLSSLSRVLKEHLPQHWSSQFDMAMSQLNARAKLDRMAKAGGNRDQLMRRHLAAIKRMSDPRQALEHMLIAEQLFSGSPEVLHELSVLLYKTEKLDEALQASARCIALNADNPHFQSFHGVLLHHAGDLTSAEFHLSNAVRSRGDIEVFRRRLADLQHSMLVAANDTSGPSAHPLR